MQTCFVYKPVELDRQGNITYFYPNVAKIHDWRDVANVINKKWKPKTIYSINPTKILPNSVEWPVQVEQNKGI